MAACDQSGIPPKASTPLRSAMQNYGGVPLCAFILKASFEVFGEGE